MTVLESIAFLTRRGWSVTLDHQNNWEVLRPRATTPLVRDREGLCRLAEAVKQAEAEARQC